MIKPPALYPGKTVGVVAPAGRVDLPCLHKGVTWLEKRGLKVILGKHVAQQHRYFAGEDRERAEDFNEMLQNKAIDAVICARGGVGAARIIPFLSSTLLSHSPKIFVGSSDITSLLLYMTESLGWVCFHGPMVATQFCNEPELQLETQFFQILSGELPEMRFDGIKILRPGNANGLLTGGCLTLICTTIGTPYEITTQNKILFIEDVNEAPFRIDRMLSYLKTLGKFEQVRGVIFGQMPQCQAETLPGIILDILKEYTFPILFGFPSGHGDATATLPFGLPVQLDADSGRLRMIEPAVL